MMAGPHKAWSFAGLVAMVVLFPAIFYTTGSGPLVSWLVSASLVTFCMFGIDKSLARSGGSRIPEAVLHLMALAGGFTGGWLGMLLFRHKIRKPVFPAVLLVATLVYLCVLFGVLPF